MSASTIDAGIEFLREALAGGPMKSLELLALAKAAGLTKSTLARARQRSGASSVRRGGVWWTKAEESIEPRRRAQTGRTAPVARSTVLDQDAMNQHGYLREFEQWMKPHGSAGAGQAWTPERRAAIVGFVANTGSINGAARFAGVQPSTVRRWLDRGRADADRYAKLEAEGNPPETLSEHFLFLRSYLLAMGWLCGRLMGVVNSSALNGNVADAKWCLTMFHEVRARIEVDHSPAIEVDEQQRRDDLLAKLVEGRVRRKALESGESDP